MRAYTEDFDEIHFTDSKFEAPVISGRTMRIRVTDLFLLRGHPLTAESFGPHSGWLVFSGVARSTREVTEYIGGRMAPGGFKEPYQVEDGPFPVVENGLQKEYAFEGVLVAPWAWIDWTVRAESFQLEVD